MSVLAVVLTVLSLRHAYRMYRAYPAPAEDGDSHRKETEPSVPSP